MEMKVRNAGPAAATEIVPSVETIGAELICKYIDGIRKQAVIFQGFIIGEIAKVFNMPLGEYHQVAWIEGIQVNRNNEAVPARHLKAPYIGIAVPDGAEDALHPGLIPFNI